jgi:tRNA modification GTPase
MDEALLHRSSEAPDTIFALASAQGRAGVAMIRISGPRSFAALAAMTGRADFPPRTAKLATLRRPSDGDALDKALVLLFPGPKSFTGEDVVELHLHGGPAVVQAVLEALGKDCGLAVAEPGAFTRRAFVAGKIDLTEVEGLADLVAAETEAQRRQAMRQANGALGRLYEDWRDRLVRTLAHLEAAIDFPDEDLPPEILDGARDAVKGLLGDVSRHLDDGHRGERVRDGISVALIGPPNAGKSSLLNRLAGRDAAIVSTEAGTTRDVIEVALDLGGFPVMLADTAGLREADGAVEAEGVARAKARAETSDIRLAVIDIDRVEEDLRALEDLLDETDLVALNKADRKGELELSEIVAAASRTRPVHVISATTGQGLDALLETLEARVSTRFDLREAPTLSRARQRLALEDVRGHLASALEAKGPIELFVEDMRLASRALGRVTGRVDVEDILDTVFADFCIGK